MYVEGKIRSGRFRGVGVSLWEILKQMNNSEVEHILPTNEWVFFPVGISTSYYGLKYTWYTSSSFETITTYE